MTWNDLRNDTFMFYIIIGPIYRFVRYEMKTKRQVRVDHLMQIRKPITRFDLELLYSLQRIHLNDDADLILCEHTEKRTIVYKVTAENKDYRSHLSQVITI